MITKNTKIIITLLILGFFTIIFYFISGLSTSIEFLLSIFIYSIIFYLFHMIWKKIRKKEYLNFNIFFNSFLFRISILILFTVLLIGGLAYLSNEKYPAKMPEFTISNGEKTVKFQAMVHIAKKSFYEKIKENLKKFKKDGGVYFYEGVKPGTKENHKKFNEAIGIEFDKDLYKNFSKLYGVNFQDNREFLGLINDLDFNVDLNIDEIIEQYEKTNTNTEKKGNMNSPIDINKEILNTLSKLKENELKILIYVNQAILNFIIGSERTQNILSNNFTNEKLFEVILDKRNEVLSNAIIDSKYDKIYITYGLLHFKGIFKLLQKNDPNWKIIKTEYLYPIKN